MPRIFRIWIDVDEYDPITDQWTDVQTDLPPTGEFVARDDSDDARLCALRAAQSFASRLHEANEAVVIVDDVAS